MTHTPDPGARGLTPVTRRLALLVPSLADRFHERTLAPLLEEARRRAAG